MPMIAITTPPFWVVPGNRNFGVNLIIGIFRGIGLLGALICAVPEDPNAAWLFQQVAQPARLVAPLQDDVAALVVVAPRALVAQHLGVKQCAPAMATVGFRVGTTG
mgnify:CR=1 FL=1